MEPSRTPTCATSCRMSEPVTLFIPPPIHSRESAAFFFSPKVEHFGLARVQVAWLMKRSRVPLESKRH